MKCHIGPGESWFVRSKLSGVGQVFAVMFHTYPRPIPTPVHNLRPARETCEACHWPQKYGEDRVAGHQQVRRRRKQFPDQDRAADEDRRRQRGHRNSRHAPGPRRRTSATAIPTRRARPSPGWNTTTTASKTVYAATAAKPDGAGLTMREMDCMDCHNRPSHTFDLPDRALDRAMAAGQFRQRCRSPRRRRWRF